MGRVQALAAQTGIYGRFWRGGEMRLSFLVGVAVVVLFCGPKKQVDKASLHNLGISFIVVVAESLSPVRLFVTPRTATR